ncbi:uncharacterized protein LOC142312790 [Anomaloglossus baeobatrachus]|uniref:uncharacterized protein LOC142312790 n=1 Tax=Anomaloglossus baeobatrachus TaxID=238106 RepID=UPI003F506687
MATQTRGKILKIAAMTYDPDCIHLYCLEPVILSPIPVRSDSPEDMPNLRFYQNQIEFQPHGVTIETIHQFWWNDYQELEANHSYIQWLFPLREPGVNPYARPLTPAEITRMKADEDVRWRLLESYKLMLGFYGILLLDENTGEVSRAENWKERYHNLNRRSHNNLRITRILKCLGEMGYDHFQAPLVQFFLEETLCNNQLPNVKRSVLDYFMFAVKDKQQRRKLVHFAWENNKSQELLICRPGEKLRNYTLKRWKENERTTEEMEDEKTNPPSNDLHQYHQQKTRTVGDMEDYGTPGVGCTRDYQASEHKDGMTSSRNDKQTIQDNSSRNSKLIIEINSSRNKKEVTESISLVHHKKLLTQETWKRNEGLTTVKTSFVNKNKTTRSTNQENKTKSKKTGMFKAESPENEEDLDDANGPDISSCSSSSSICRYKQPSLKDREPKCSNQKGLIADHIIQPPRFYCIKSYDPFSLFLKYSIPKVTPSWTKINFINTSESE